MGIKVWLFDRMKEETSNIMCDAAVYHTVRDSSGIVDSLAMGKGGGNWLRVSQLRLLYRVSTASKRQYDRNSVITDISDANPQSTKPKLTNSPCLIL